MSGSKRNWLYILTSILFLSLFTINLLVKLRPDIMEYYKNKNAPTPIIRFENYEACLASEPRIDEDGLTVRRNVKGIVKERFKTIEDYCRGSKYIEYTNK